jgi:hypothetical protein
MQFNGMVRQSGVSNSTSLCHLRLLVFGTPGDSTRQPEACKNAPFVLVPAVPVVEL